jgi:hypothetical protein
MTENTRPEGQNGENSLNTRKKGESIMGSGEKGQKSITRREFVKGAAVGTAGVAAAGALASCGAPTPEVIKETVEVPVEVTKIVEKEVEVPVEVTKIVEVAAGAAEAGPVTLEVFDPFGPVEVTHLYSPRLDTLEGKTIAYTEGTWMVGTAKPLVLELLQNMYPTLKVVDIPQYGDIRDMSDEDVSALVKELGVDAVIVGNAG